MSELSPETSALFDVARDQDDPTTEDMARVRAKLVARVGAGVVAGGATAAATGTAVAAGKPLVALAVNVVLALSVAGGVAGTLYAIDDGSEAVATVERGAVADVVASIPRPRERAQDARVETPPLEVDPRDAEATPEVVATSASPSAQPSGTGKGGDITGETALLDRAQAALREGRADDALRALDEHGERYADGALREERQGARILTLCRLGRVAEARAAAARFLAESPRSPVAARVRGSCAAP